MIGRIILVAVLLTIIIFTYAGCMVAHTSDEDSERLYQDYLRYKRHKEQEGKK